MGIRKYKPTTPGRRGASVADFVEVTRDEPEKSLVRPLHSRGGRNNTGRITTRHQGGGHKRAYRVIDFRRADKDGVPAKVAHIEYDPNRTAAGGGGNAEQPNINGGKAGGMRGRGKRPPVGGVPMTPIAPPHGGGEGKTSGGRHPATPTGNPGGPPRRAHKPSDQLIVRRR